MIYFSRNGISEPEDAIATLLPPSVRYKNDEEEYEARECDDGYVTGALYIKDSAEHLGDGTFRLTREIKNTSAHSVSFQDILSVMDSFAASRYLIPCILYNGNEHGSSNTPKSLTVDGYPWEFAYDRMGIPSCTLTENASVGVALFASAEDKASLVSSCSLIPDGRYHTHRIIRPVVEAPYSYTSKNIMTERYDTYTTLGAGESMTSHSYLCILKPTWENYACAQLIDRALELLSPENEPSLSTDEVFSLGQSFAKALLYDYRGQKMIITHYAQRLFRYQHMVKITLDQMREMMADPYYTELGAFDERFEMGWADQGLLNARMLAEGAIAEGNCEMLDTAIGIFDAFCSTQKENGLCYTLYEQNFDEEAEKTATPDACNLGWGAAEMVRMYKLLKSQGIDKSEYVRFSRGVCDFFISSYTDEHGYGKSYYMDGTPAQTLGSIGGFMITAMLEVYGHTKEQKYLDSAIRAHDFYYKRDLDKFVCTAGALDCTSIDKETAYPFVTSSLMLYDITGDEKYVTRAEMAAYYFTSWMFFYEVLYENGSEFTEYGYKTTGGTAISAEHHAIDAWGSVIVPELHRIATLTGKKTWERIARLMWASAIQGMTLREGHLIHGVQRPIGSHNEGFFQARWTKYRPTPEERGHYNDCLSAWCGAYRMHTITRMRNSGEIAKIEKR